MKTGRRWGDAAITCPRRPWEGALPALQHLDVALPLSRRKESTPLDAPGLQHGAGRGKIAVRASWTMKGDRGLPVTSPESVVCASDLPAGEALVA